MARQIDIDTADAVFNGKTLNRGNTHVVQHDGGTCKVLLHGHKIAEYSKNSGLRFCLCGYATNVTMARLRALLEVMTDNMAFNVIKGEPTITVTNPDGKKVKHIIDPRKWQVVRSATDFKFQ